MNKFMVVIGLSALGVFSGFRLAQLVPDPSRAVPPVPLTAHIHETTFTVKAHGSDKGAQGARFEDFDLYIRGDGSEARLYNRRAPDGKLHQSRVINDVAKGRMTTVDSATESITTRSFKPDGPVLHPSNCGAGPGAETMAILGHIAVKVSLRQDPKSPLPLSASPELWEAPDLGCVTLRFVVRTEPDRIALLREVTSVWLGDPDASVFAIPDGYTERSPAKVMQERSRRFGVDMRPPSERSESAYWNSHANNPDRR